MKKRGRHNADLWFPTKSSISAATGVTRGTVDAWLGRAGFPRKTPNGWPKAEVLAYSKESAKKAEKTMKGADVDLRRLKLQKQIEKLTADTRAAVALANIAAREDEGKKIEHEARKGEWFSRAEVEELAVLFVSALDSAVEAVGLVSRDAAVVEAVKERFAGIRKKLAEISG